MSHKSASKAGKLGYTHVRVFEAGYPAWLKLVKKPVKVDITAGAEEGSIHIDAFKKILSENPNSILLIDVRDPDEFAAGHFKSAVNIPSDNLEKALKSMKGDKPVVFVCATGARSGEAYYMTQDIRPDIKEVYYVEAEITYNQDGSYHIKPGM